MNRIYLELSGNKCTPDTINRLTSKCHQEGVMLFAALPRIDIDGVGEDLISLLEQTEVDGYLVRTYGQLYCLKNTTKKIIVDYSLHIYNKLVIEHYMSMGIETTISPELDLREAAELSGEVIMYGRLPLMITRQCMIGLYAGHKSNERYCKYRHNNDSYLLKDKKNINYPIVRDCDTCLAMILSGDPDFRSEGTKALRQLTNNSLRYIFTLEDQAEIRELVKKAVFYV